MDRLPALQLRLSELSRICEEYLSQQKSQYLVRYIAVLISQTKREIAAIEKVDMPTPAAK